MKQTWVIYLRAVKNTDGMKAVCEQSEWEEMELAQPGKHHLIQAGITTEAEAELLARGESGDSKVKSFRGREISPAEKYGASFTPSLPLRPSSCSGTT